MNYQTLAGRDKILQAFNNFGEYSHVLPFRLDEGYIDGMFHVSMLAGAALLAGDGDIRWLADDWLGNLRFAGEDARNWRISGGDSIVATKTKPQGFAGPAAARWAYQLPPTLRTRLLAWTAQWVIDLYPRLPFLRQHVNSVMLACLFTGRRPRLPADLAQINPFYCAIAGQAFPPAAIKAFLPVHKPWGSAWVWKQFPVQLLPAENVGEEYTPTALYVADVLQRQLQGEE